MYGANRALTILKASTGGVDNDGRSMRTWDVSAVVVGFLHPKSAAEEVDGTFQVVEYWEAYLPPSVDIDFHDAIQDESGTIYRIEAVLPHHFIGVHHITARLVKAGA